MWITVLIFAIAAAVGLTMALAVFQGRFPPVASAVVHGALAATGLVLLIIAVCVHRVVGPARWALGFFLLAALGGFILAFAYHARRKNLPANFVVGHATLAVIGFLLLLAAALHLIR
jgi:predicted membrane channel-forming protein YqfA (hemolysin III family)